MAGPLPEGLPWPSDHRLNLSNSECTFHAYVHIPFCDVRCGYCDFNTYTASEIGDVRRGDFHRALIDEMKFSRKVLEANNYQIKPLSSIFFGGGTPTLFEAGQFSELNSQLKELFGFEDDIEITSEANPDNVNLEYLRNLKQSGINRISFGVQSFDPEVLMVLDRTHDAARVPDVIGWAKEIGFRVSIDLIYGAPGESLESWKKTVDTAMTLGVEHISAYALIIEAGTKLERKIRSGEIAQVDDDLLAEKYEYASEVFETSGFDWYEISNWGVPSIHNQAYWRSMDWWGYGPGAHSHISGTRWWNRKHPVAYRDSVQSGTPAQAYEEVSKGSIAEEKLLLELRTLQGVSNQVLKDLKIPPSEVAKFIARGLIEPKPGNRIAVTKAGRLLADGIVLELLSAAEV